VAPLPASLAAPAQADRAEVEARRAEIRQVRRQIEEKKRAARRARDVNLLAQPGDLSRWFEAAMRRKGSLDRYSG
jgi:cytochrome c biogenesis protein ResB